MLLRRLPRLGLCSRCYKSDQGIIDMPLQIPLGGESDMNMKTRVSFLSQEMIDNDRVGFFTFNRTKSFNLEFFLAKMSFFLDRHSWLDATRLPHVWFNISLRPDCRLSEHCTVVASSQTWRHYSWVVKAIFYVTTEVGRACYRRWFTQGHRQSTKASHSCS